MNILFSVIMSLSNALMYEGKLECGSERTANARLLLPSLAALMSELERRMCQPLSISWVRAALEPQNPVCLLDTSEVNCIFPLILYMHANSLLVACSVHGSSTFYAKIRTSALNLILLASAVGSPQWIVVRVIDLP